MSTGVYDIQALDVTITGVYTNTCPVDAYRGAGRPGGGLPARKAGRRLRARPRHRRPTKSAAATSSGRSSFPTAPQTGRLYDVGEFDGHMTLAMERAGWKSFDERLRQSKAAGKIRGIGMATYIEACAFAGSEPAIVEAQRRRHGDAVDRHADQRAGPCHRLCAVRRRKAQHRHFAASTCTRATPTGSPGGGGTGGSRSIPLGGVSAARAGEDLAEKIKKIAADELEASAADIELVDGTARIVGTDRSIGFRGDRQGGQEAGRPRRASASSCRTSAPIRTAPISARSRSIPETGADRGRRLYDRRRFRRDGEPDPARRPGAWRRRAGHRPGADREHGLSRGRPAADRELHGLRACRAPTTCRSSISRRATCPRPPMRWASRARARPARSARRRRAERRDRRALPRLRHRPYRDAGDARRGSGTPFRTRNQLTRQRLGLAFGDMPRSTGESYTCPLNDE